MKKIKCPHCGKMSENPYQCTNCGNALFKQQTNTSGTITYLPLLIVATILVYIGINQEAIFVQIFFIILALIMFVFVFTQVLKSILTGYKK